MHPVGIVIIGKTESVIGIQPAVIRMASAGCLMKYRFHPQKLVFIGTKLYQEND